MWMVSMGMSYHLLEKLDVFYGAINAADECLLEAGSMYQVLITYFNILAEIIDFTDNYDI